MEKISCKNCGANLDVSVGTRFLTCSYCSSKLEVVGGDASTRTQLQQLAENARMLEEQMKVLSRIRLSPPVPRGGRLVQAFAIGVMALAFAFIVYVFFSIVSHRIG